MLTGRTGNRQHTLPKRDCDGYLTYPPTHGIHPLWLSGTSCPKEQVLRFTSINRGRSMKKVALALVLVVAGLSLGGCFVGKGKAPAPIVTKG